MKENFTIEEEIFINQFSQQLHSLEEMRGWFNLHCFEDKKDILKLLLLLVIQSHPTYNEIEDSAISLKKLSSTPATKLLNKNKPFSKFGYEICNLPEKELTTGFEILLLTLAKADTRRKEQEKTEDCHHWWHKDLSNEDYLNKLKKYGID